MWFLVITGNEILNGAKVCKQTFPMVLCSDKSCNDKCKRDWDQASIGKCSNPFICLCTKLC